MRLVKVNKTDYINPEHVICIRHEKEKDDKNIDIADTGAWWIYTIDGKVKTDNRFNVQAFIRGSR